MAEIDHLQLYHERTFDPDCYIWSDEFTVEIVNRALAALEREELDPDTAKVAHGLLEFGTFGEMSGEIQCIPWMVAPDAPRRAAIGGRHSVVAQEFVRVFGVSRNFWSDASFVRDSVGTYTVLQNEQALCVVPFYSTTYFEDPKRRKIATDRIIEVSRKFPSIEFCLDLPWLEGGWTVV